MSEATLIAKQLSCRRGERTLFSGLSFMLMAGEWLHVQGANGMGKTTLMRSLAGLALPAEGELEATGFKLGADSLYCGHSNALNDDLSAADNLHYLCALDGLKLPAASLRQALVESGLKTQRELACRHLSAGQKRRVLLARLRLRQEHRPARLLLLDEPFAALDTDGCSSLGQLLEQHLSTGGMAIITSHQSIPLAEGRVCCL